jgi:hypothetical protein
MRKALALLLCLWTAPAFAQSLGSTVLQTRPAGSGGPTVDDIAYYAAAFPGYIVGNWYIPYGYASTTISIASVANRIACYPGLFLKRFTTSNIGTRITTAQAASNVQLAIYNSNNITGRPTGSPIVQTGNISGAVASTISAAAVAQFNPGVYWFCSNTDTSGIVFVTQAASGSPAMAALFGTTVQGNSLGGGGGGLTGQFGTQSFGTWGDLTNFASWTDNINTVPFPATQFQIGSVP